MPHNGFDMFKVKDTPLIYMHAHPRPPQRKISVWANNNYIIIFPDPVNCSFYLKFFKLTNFKITHVALSEISPGNVSLQ